MTTSKPEWKKRHRWAHKHGLDHIESACICGLRRLRQGGLRDQYSRDGIAWRTVDGVPSCSGVKP